jgi:hypothetical protein
VAERRRRSNEEEAPVADDVVPADLQLEEGKGECEARLQRGTMAARVELTRRTGQRRRGGQNPTAQGISGGPDWTEGRGEKEGCSRGPGGGRCGRWKKEGGAAARPFYIDARRWGMVEGVTPHRRRGPRARERERGGVPPRRAGSARSAAVRGQRAREAWRGHAARPVRTGEAGR